MTDREAAGLRGRVRICSAERDYVYPDRHWMMSTTDTFSPNGNLLERLHRNPDGSRWSTICRYDEREQLIEKEQANNEHRTHQSFSYRYDPLGRLERVILHSAQEGDRVYESVQYAADGTKAKTSYPTPLDDTQRKTTGVAAEAMLHVSIDAVIIMTVHDVNDRAIRKVLYDSDARVIRRIAFCSDARGLLLEEGEVVGGSIREDFRNVYRYDALGRQIEVDRRWGDFGGERRSFEYNGRGDIALEIIERNAGLMKEDTDIQAWTQRFAYQYDDHENWIARTTETIRQSGETRVSMIERRELTYC